jgi:fumarate hydratase class II
MTNSQNFRIETDSFGEIKVPDEAYYGAQTQRSVQNFPICNDNAGHKMPKEVIESMLYVKKASALTSRELMEKNPDAREFKKFSVAIANQITEAVDIILNDFDNFYQNHFPLVVWQTGSGTQTNMNTNEVIAGVANEKATGKKGGKSPIHPNDHCNLGQSSNDTFPTAMNVAIALTIYKKLLPTLTKFANELGKKEKEFKEIVKIGRTHTQDATPVTLGQEFSAYRHQIELCKNRIEASIKDVLYLSQGGTAVGTGLNCHPDFAKNFAKNVSKISKIEEFKTEFKTNPNKFSSLSNNDELVELSGSFNTLATAIMKIANDIRFLASGPRSGLGEISLPENEPGSSIMPGKVNPTQCEALTMIACQIMGNNVAVTAGGSNGHFELNVFRPMIVRNVIESINLLSDGINSFIDQCLVGIKANEERIKQLLEQSLMLVTALNPYIGYDNCAKIAKHAHKTGSTLRQAAKELGFFGDGEGKIKEADWEKIMDAKKMI